MLRLFLPRTVTDPECVIIVLLVSQLNILYFHIKITKMGIITTCEQLFGTSDLYQVLGVEKTASEGQIKKAYHKISLQVHPDRVGEEGREESTKKFQCVGAVYAVLSDKERRGLYDDTGEVEDEMDPLQDKDKDWEEYWRFLFPKVTLDDIQKFENEYRESADEREDLKKAYIESEGDMGVIIDTVMCAREEDEERFRDIINEMIKNKEVTDRSFSTHLKLSVIPLKVSVAH